MKKPAERRAWILAYLKARQDHCSVPWRVDVLDSNFVWAYIEETDAPCKVSFVGAPFCPLLGTDLGAMFRAGQLDRRTAGIEGLAGQGFPRWVWSYALKKDQK